MKPKNIKRESVYLTVFLTLCFLSTGLYAGKNTQRDNVLLITIDTLRAERLHVYNSEAPLTPNIDGLAEQGTLFSRAFASATTTLPSHATIHLGVSPLSHGVHDNFNFLVNDRLLTLAEHLKHAGYTTAAFVAAYPLDKRFGLSQGFDLYNDAYPRVSTHKFAYGERKAEVVVDEAVNWLKEQNNSWFLWIHCFDPHDPYDPPEPFKSRYAEHPYDGEVAYLDHALGKLVSYLKDNRLFENTVVFLTGDHGESLGQHGEMTHGFFVYNSTLRIPLILSAPGLKSGRVDGMVSHLDIFPTICDAVGIKKPENLQGISLLPAAKGKAIRPRSLYFETMFPYYNKGWAPLTGYIRDGKKFIESPLPELYDLKSDFDETLNILQKEDLGKYRKNLGELSKKLTIPEQINTEKKFDRESYETLRSLGYISNPRQTTNRKIGPDYDVKTVLPFYNKAMTGKELHLKGRTQEGIALLRSVIRERPDVDISYVHLADIYKDLHHPSEALAVLKEGYKAVPSSYFVLVNYIDVLGSAGLHQEVIKILSTRSYVQMEHDSEMWNRLGFAFWNIGDDKSALAAFKKAVAIDPGYANIYTNLGAVYSSIYSKTHDPEFLQKSLQNYSSAVHFDPSSAAAFKGLGNAYRDTRNFVKAIDCWEKALVLDPHSSPSLFDIGMAYLEIRDEHRALEHFIQYKEIYYTGLADAARQNLDRLIARCRER